MHKNMFAAIAINIVAGLSLQCLASIDNKEVWNLTCNTNRTVTRAVGSNFSVEIVSPCKNTAVRCRIAYLFYNEEFSNGINSSNKVIVDKNATNGSTTRAYDEYGTTVYYNYRISPDQKSTIFDMKMVSEDKSAVKIMQVVSSMDCPSPLLSSFRFASIRFAGCQNQSHFNITLLDSQSNIARFKDIGKVVCNKDLIGGAIFENGNKVLHTYCNYDATWKDAERIICLYPIRSKLLIDSNDEYSSTVTLQYNHAAEDHTVALNCSPGDASTSHFEHNSKEVTMLSIHPNINNHTVSCYVENNFTKYFDTNQTYVSASVLNITFGPFPPPQQSKLCSMRNGSIQFYSNPSSSNVTLELIENGTNDVIPARVETCCQSNYGVEGQIIVPVNQSLKTSKFYLRSRLFGEYINYSLVMCDITTETTREMDTTTVPLVSGKQPLSTTILVLIAIGAVLFVLIIIIVIIMCMQGRKRKRKTMGLDKVETVNPIYETSNEVCPGESAHEELDNPLYASAHTPNGSGAMYAEVKKNIKGSEEKSKKPTKTRNDVYASVDITKNLQKGEGKENSGFAENDEDNATYSVVNKKKNQKGKKGTEIDEDPQITATYAEVNKKTKQRKGNSNSDRPKASDADTYAAVDLSKKKDKKKSGGSQTQTTPEVDTTYAEVNKKNKKK